MAARERNHAKMFAIVRGRMAIRPSDLGPRSARSNAAKNPARRARSSDAARSKSANLARMVHVKVARPDVHPLTKPSPPNPASPAPPPQKPDKPQEALPRAAPLPDPRHSHLPHLPLHLRPSHLECVR